MATTPTPNTQGTTRPIRLGVIGTGLAVEQLHWPALKRMRDRFEIVAFAEPDSDHAAHFADYTGTAITAHTADYPALLARDDVEAVLISLPIPLNYPVTRDALTAGKHVICEKPAGVDEAEGQQYFALAAAFPNQTLLVAENYFYRDDLRLARTLLDDDAIGRVHLMAWRTVSRSVPVPGKFSSTPWRHHPQYRGGSHLDGGVHHIAQIRLLCGGAVSVAGAVQFANRTIDAPSDLTLTLTFASGAIGSYTAAYPEIAVPPEPNEMRLYGTEGVMVFGKQQQLSVYRPDGRVDEHTFTDSDPGYYNEFLNFHEALTQGAPVIGTAAQSFANMQIVLRGLDAAEQQRTVPITDAPVVTVPLWRPHGATGLFDGLPLRHEMTTHAADTASE